MPIGNLTSQLFANIYLNEWDFFVRQNLRPLAYVRYGDDFLLYFTDEMSAKSAQAAGQQWLESELVLSVNLRQNIVVPARRGLLVLGHRIYSNRQIIVDSTVFERALSADDQIAINYRSLKLSRRQRHILEWCKIEV